MKKISVRAKEIWGFLPNKVISKSLDDYVDRYSWKNIPRVPIFAIPENLRQDGFEYILMDGNTRRNVAGYRGEKLPVALYIIGEKVDTVKGKLSPFKHSNDPHIYEKLLKMFEIRNLKLIK